MSDAIDITAPVPGLVATVSVQAGAKVEEGDVLIVLHSMKMEIPIPAEGPGTVAEVLVEEGQEIDTGAVIARLTAL
ncbi:MAG: acetyl-CoA carboxylase biotin carboxyl carrier protein subunit [Armatimonadetes bacterium]|nr:acetyl-CoA carboxylase biotin carboxyl carrier protein subunit [Armatimonadota bacterium]